MKRPTTQLELAADIREALRRLRWRIRAYVWGEGLALMLVWLGATFWIGLALDYLPVLVGASEMPQAARTVLLGGIAVMLGVILYRWILRRTFVPLSDRNLALLLERRFPELEDSLVTAVELSRMPHRTEDEHLRMLRETHAAAVQRIRQVRVGRVFNYRPLGWSVLGATLLALSVAGLYAGNRPAWELWAQRLYLLRNEPWPRQAQIEVVGLESVVADGEEGGAASMLRRPFLNRIAKAAKGSELKLLVRADASARRVPEVCTIYYRSGDGDRGWVHMNRMGGIRDGKQLYSYGGAPFSSILSDIQFDVVGYDHRLRDYRVEAVDSPALIATQLDCRYPDYMVDERLSLWLPRTLDYTPGMSLPHGTQVVLRCTANKPLRQAFVKGLANEEQVPEAPAEPAPADGLSPSARGSDLDTEITVVKPSAEDPRRLELVLGALQDTLQLEITLWDEDQVVSDPLRLTVSAIEDRPPVVDVRLRGIGPVVTPDVLLPLGGTVQDDYATAKTWLELIVNDSAPVTRELPRLAGGAIDTEVDFREWRTQDAQFQLKPQDKVVLTVKAEDRHDLEGGPHVGVGDRFELDVVTADQLLAALETRELALRRRFEQIIDETTEMRDSLLRVKTDAPPPAATGSETAAQQPPAAGEPQAEEAAEAAREGALRVLRVQRALLQSQKSAQETLGVAAGFRDIRDELTNNRLDTEDRKTRLSELIAAPLQAIGEQEFPRLDARLTELAAELDRLNKAQADMSSAEPLVDQTLAASQEILRLMDQVLNNMLDLETYNELLDLVRGLIDEQEQLLEATKKQQKQQALDLLK